MSIDRDYTGKTEGERDLEQYLSAPGALPMQQDWLNPYNDHSGPEALGRGAYGLGAGSTDRTYRSDDYNQLRLPQDIIDKQQAAEADVNPGTAPVVSHTLLARAPGVEGVARTDTVTPMVHGSMQSSSFNNEMRAAPTWQAYRSSAATLTGSSSKEDFVLKLVDADTRMSALEQGVKDIYARL